VHYPLNVKRGEPLECSMWIENVGVAPLYHPYRLALRVTQNGFESVTEVDSNLKKWLPGDICLQPRIDVPPMLKPGTVQVSAGIVKPGGTVPAIRFAVEEQDECGWVEIGSMTVE
jgi:hypothetical protein